MADTRRPPLSRGARAAPPGEGASFGGERAAPLPSSYSIRSADGRAVMPCRLAFARWCFCVLPRVRCLGIVRSTRRGGGQPPNNALEPWETRPITKNRAGWRSIQQALWPFARRPGAFRPDAAFGLLARGASPTAAPDLVDQQAGLVARPMPRRSAGGEELGVRGAT